MKRRVKRKATIIPNLPKKAQGIINVEIIFYNSFRVKLGNTNPKLLTMTQNPPLTPFLESRQNRHSGIIDIQVQKLAKQKRNFIKILKIFRLGYSSISFPFPL